MITKTQWKKFFEVVYVARKMNMNPVLKGEKVYQMNMEKYEIITIKEEQPRTTRYGHYSTTTPHNTLNRLYSSVSFDRVSLDKVIIFSHYLKKVKKMEVVQPQPVVAPAPVILPPLTPPPPVPENETPNS